jgi:ATP-dependent DNA helicase RecG
VLGEVVGSGVRPTRRPRFKIFEMLVRDATGSLRAVWFNQPFLADVFRPHQRVILFGKLELTSHGLQMQNPQYEVLPQESGEDADVVDKADKAADEDTLHTGRIVPIYEKTGTVTTKMQRVLVHHALADLPANLPDPLPRALR